MRICSRRRAAPSAGFARARVAALLPCSLRFARSSRQLIRCSLASVRRCATGAHAARSLSSLGAGFPPPAAVRGGPFRCLAAAVTPSVALFPRQRSGGRQSRGGRCPLSRAGVVATLPPRFPRFLVAGGFHSVASAPSFRGRVPRPRRGYVRIWGNGQNSLLCAYFYTKRALDFVQKQFNFGRSVLLSGLAYFVGLRYNELVRFTVHSAASHTHRIPQNPRKRKPPGIFLLLANTLIV